MEALRLWDVGRASVDETTLPEPCREETVVRVHYCALCRTDAKMWREGQRDLRAPRVLGHELAGTDEALGQRVVVWPGSVCDACPSCQEGSENLCPDIRIMGFNRDGGLAQAMVAPTRSLIPIPAGLSSRLACLAEPLACCVNALERISAGPGVRTLIFGAGPVGLLMALAARSVAAEAFIVDKDPSRLEQSQAYLRRVGAAADTRPVWKGLDAAVNACPATETLGQGLAAIRPGGRFCLFSGLPAADSVSASLINEIHYRQLSLFGAYGCTREQMRRALDIIDAAQNVVELLVEREIALGEVVDHLPRIADGKALKVLVRID